MAKADGSICFKEVWQIEFDPAVRNRVYLLYGGTGSVNAKKWQARGGGLYVSNDRGKNWEFLTEPWMHAYANTLEIDPTNSNVLYMGGSSSPLSSTESNLNEVYVTTGLVYKSTDAGKTWTELPTGWGATLGARMCTSIRAIRTSSQSASSRRQPGKTRHDSRQAALV